MMVTTPREFLGHCNMIFKVAFIIRFVTRFQELINYFLFSKK